METLIAVVGWIVAGISGAGWLLQRTRDGYDVALLRERLKNAELEREKLRHEVDVLKNPPYLKQSRRELYDRLRETLRTFRSTGDASDDAIFELHSLKHEARFLFDEPIVDLIGRVLSAAVSLHVSNIMLRSQPLSQADREHHARQRTEASHLLHHEAEGLQDAFLPYLKAAP